MRGRQVIHRRERRRHGVGGWILSSQNCLREPCLSCSVALTVALRVIMPTMSVPRATTLTSTGIHPDGNLSGDVSKLSPSPTFSIYILFITQYCINYGAILCALSRTHRPYRQLNLLYSYLIQLLPPWNDLFISDLPHGSFAPDCHSTEFRK